MLFRRIATALGLTGLMLTPAPAAHAAPSKQDVAYLQAAHQSNLAEIKGGRIAWQKTSDPKIKDLAATFMRDHIHLDAALSDTARQLRVTLPVEPNPHQQALAARYEAAPAETFDRLYISTQMSQHRKALRLTRKELAAGAEAAVKDLAGKAEPVIAGHHTKLRAAAIAEGMAGHSGRPHP